MNDTYYVTQNVNNGTGAQYNGPVQNNPYQSQSYPQIVDYQVYCRGCGKLLRNQTNIQLGICLQCEREEEARKAHNVIDCQYELVQIETKHQDPLEIQAMPEISKIVEPPAARSKEWQDFLGGQDIGKEALHREVSSWWK